MRTTFLNELFSAQGSRPAAYQKVLEPIQDVCTCPMSVIRALPRGRRESLVPRSHTPIAIRPGIESALNLGLRDCCKRDPAFRLPFLFLVRVMVLVWSTFAAGPAENAH